MNRELIISIEGIPCAGKTTLQNMLKDYYGGVAIDCVQDYGGGLKRFSTQPRTYEEIRERERIILNLNYKRAKLSEKIKKSGRVAILDQGHGSAIAYSYAYSKYVGINTFRECANDYFSLIINSELKLPDLYIYLKIPFSTFLRRYKTRGRFVNKIWFNKNFIKDYTFFYYSYPESVDGVSTLSIDGEKSREEVFLESIKFIEDLDTSKKRDVTQIENRFEDFLTQIENNTQR